MTNLLLGVFLGLFVVVHPTPVNTVTQIPANLEEDVYHEVKAEEFIVDHFTAMSVSKAQSTITESAMDRNVPSSSTESPRTPVVIQESQQLSSDNMTEGSGGNYQTTPLSVSDAQSPTPTTQTVMDKFSVFQVSDQPLTDFTTEGSADPTSSRKFLEGSGFSPNTAPNVPTSTQTCVMETTAASSTTFQTSEDFTGFFTDGSGTEESPTQSGEGSGLFSTTTLDLSHIHNPASTTKSVKSTTVASPISESTKTSTSNRPSEVPSEKIKKSRIFGPLQNVQTETEMLIHSKEIGNGNEDNESNMHKGHVTPDWIIIVGFIVALAALVAVCAAIATRDKWNHPNQVPITKANSSNQQREQEMQTFMHKDEPKENGNNGEYTVIPLEDIPENCSSD
ncbi:uncharacterized protein LOC108234755 [Kryptolebias marmoratus]|uniref:uncharacterized protein LOC108234755 n=1 Tax=Kryptolebias marmoratus TaxID=37003 RepID=UPI0007F8B682|nr:uncharacterized protein LOC108234755 [Kryptolebias marmoratus]